MSSARGCRKPLPWLHQEAISYLHPAPPSTCPWCRDLGGCPGPPALGQSQACRVGVSKPLGAGPWLRGGALSWLCWREPAAEPPWELVLRRLPFLPWSPTLVGLGLPADGGGGPQLPWSCTWVPPPHPARHPQGQQLRRARSLASPSWQLFPAAACAGGFQGSAQEVSEGLVREEETG